MQGYMRGVQEWSGLVLSGKDGSGGGSECHVTIHETILCRWGAIEDLVTNNAPQYIQAADFLSEKFHIHHIKISPYNSRAQGHIERLMMSEKP